MIVVCAFSHTPTFLGDNKPGPYSNAELATIWMDWVAELGGVSNHHLMLLGPHGFELPPSVKAWGSYDFNADRRNVVGWPQGPNSMFEQVGWLLALRKNKDPWLWCEPDAIPLRPTWVTEIEREYREARKPFMGSVIEAGTSFPKHMNGNGVYPANFFGLAPRLMDPKAGQIAFDIRAASQIIPQCHSTSLIYSLYRAWRMESLAQFRQQVPEDVCLFHSDKYGRVIELLRAKRNGVLVEPDPFKPVELADHPISTLMTVDHLCALIRDHVTTESDRQRLWAFLREGKYNVVGFGRKAAQPLAAAVS
jgi:hypothetical protein